MLKLNLVRVAHTDAASAILPSPSFPSHGVILHRLATASLGFRWVGAQRNYKCSHSVYMMLETLCSELRTYVTYSLPNFRNAMQVYEV